MPDKPQVVVADSLAWMRDRQGEPFDAIVTDPPYAIGFMQKKFDTFKSIDHFRAWTQEWAEQALNVVKPGAYLAAFGFPRTFAWQVIGLHEAGWEIRDTLMWLYGSGMPKSHNLSGDIARQGLEPWTGICDCGDYQPKTDSAGLGKPMQANGNCRNCGKAYPPPTTNGYGTGLKPAYEPIVLARKPLVGTVQANFDEYGTGAMHIAAAGIPIDPDEVGDGHWSHDDGTVATSKPGYEGGFDRGGTKHADRWPANVVLDEEAAALLDEQAGPRHTSGAVKQNNQRGPGVTSYGDGLSNYQSPEAERKQATRAAVEGKSGPSRFFYTSKASKREREAGLDGLPLVRRSDGRQKDIEAPRLRTSKRRNHHPSVKPIDLMRWLCRLVVPEDGRILDPFVGSGSTLIAAYLEGMEAVGVERDDEYAKIARTRIDHWCSQGKLL